MDVECEVMLRFMCPGTICSVSVRLHIHIFFIE